MAKRRRTLTVAEYIPQVQGALNAATLRTYRHYLNVLAAELGHMALDDVMPTNIRAYAATCKGLAKPRTRSGSSGGQGAEYHAIAAARKVFGMAMIDGLAESNPAALVQRPRRQIMNRHALTVEQVADLFTAARDVDTLILRFLLETGARRQGLVDLTPERVRKSRQTVLLREKYGKEREQPISAPMLEALSDPACPLYHMTERKVVYLFGRLRERVLWADEISVSTHWLRHTAITNVERATGSYRLAAAFAGHTMDSVTGTYLKVTVHDVAWAFVQTYGGSHPLAAAPTPEPIDP